MSDILFDNRIIDDNDQTQARAAHLEEIKKLVGNAYPNKFTRTSITETAEGEDTITSIVGAFEKYVPATEAGARPTPEQLEEANAELGKFSVRVSGRLATPPRVMGKVAFVHLSDGRGRLQIYVRKQEAEAISNDSGRSVEEAESGWKLFQLLDHGDFVGVEGNLFVTKTGELSVHVRTIQFLSKALLPMPDKMHGISDPEIRQRQRYADLIASSLKIETGEDEAGERELSTREVFERRSKIITTMRRHLDEHGYIEVETPMLSPIASGAAARPFKTRHNALDIDLYARIAPELYLKRLIVGGFERVYELNRNFRNEGISTRHNPEFTMLEFYTAYKDVNWMMDFCEEMLRNVIGKATGELQTHYDTFAGIDNNLRLHYAKCKLDFAVKFDRLTMIQAISKFAYKYRHIEKFAEFFKLEIDAVWLSEPKNLSLLYNFLTAWENYGRATWHLSSAASSDLEKHDAAVIHTCKSEGVEAIYRSSQHPDDATIGRYTAYVFEKVAESNLISPTFIYDFPKVVSPLSKASPNNPAIAERFELYIAGMEIANGFSELNDPAEQFERFKDQTRQREGGDEEAMQMDEDYVRALAYGMPPAAGIGIGIDRLTMLLTNRRSIRDVILFPHMRPKARAEAPEETDKPEAAGAEPGIL